MSIDDDTTHDGDFDDGAADVPEPLYDDSKPYGVPDADAVAENAARDMAEDEAAADEPACEHEIERVKCGEETCEQNEGHGCEGHAPGDLPQGDKSAAPAPTLEPARRFKRVLVVKMYPEELAKRAVLLADAITEHDIYEAQKKKVAADMAAVLTAKWEEVKRLSRIVHAGGEEREVECELVRNDKEGSIETVRLDTGEVIDRRAQDVAERQLPLTAVVQPEPDGERPTQAQCATTRDGEQCEGVCEGDAAYCPECIADAVARDDAAEAERAKGAPRCKARVARDGSTEARCEEEAGEGGFCGQHSEPCAAQGCTEPAMGAGLFCTGHSETVAKKKKRARKGDAAEV